jgi:hypothetical protein
MSREQRQIDHIHRLLDRTRTMSRLFTDDKFLTVNVSELIGAMDEGGEEWDAEHPVMAEAEIEEAMEPVRELLREELPPYVELAQATVAYGRGEISDKALLETGGWGTCPECEQGKHGNCNGSALNTEDEIDLCACEVAKHRD